jgi:hypothetical protein
MTAPGHVMRCDQAGCTAVATVEKDAWAYCAQHGGGAARPAAKLPVDLDQVTPQESRHGIRLAEQPATAGPIGLLLEQASGHSVAKVRRLAEKIELQLDALRELIREHAAEEKRRQDEARAKAAALAEVARLEQQLAAAKAKLRGKPAPAAAGKTSTERLCDQCGKPSKAPGARGAWPRTCAACKAGAA